MLIQLPRYRISKKNELKKKFLLNTTHRGTSRASITGTRSMFIQRGTSDVIRSSPEYFPAIFPALSMVEKTEYTLPVFAHIRIDGKRR